MDKNELRETLLARRSKMPRPVVDGRSSHIVDAILKLDEWKRAKEVLLYWPIRNEVDVRPLFEAALLSGKELFMPCCRRDEPGLMDFGLVRAEEDLESGVFGIKEPCRSKCEFPDVVLPDIMIVPGVGFARDGYRIGFGGGYYDRFLARPQKYNFLAVGVCYSFQVVEEFSVETWDQPVGLVVTEKELIWQN